ncbi:MAG: twin-arginine translocase subunit TatC [Pyrinomonadaceae bacterium]|nr:twin-arginine translocase subunit TatC [Pyrinomonadaceae bacterium]MCX7639137.1 twin-arginine translocase subunit TatC [Pyrinomonadaceae bacterium]MDW8303642.1 twin-arginine translocase subunit TatC [Acidobacteriota bacterium]
MAEREEELGAQMSFLEHLDELRRRLIYCVLFIGVSFLVCWFFSDKIYNFLAIPVQNALREAQQREITIEGLTGEEKILSISNLKEGDKGVYVFDRGTRIGGIWIPAGVAVSAYVAKDSEGKIGLFTNDEIFSGGFVIPRGVKLPIDFEVSGASPDEKMIVTTAVEPFTLYVTVSLYTALALSIPFILFQAWVFISPALYKHEKAYVVPLIFLSTVSFVIGAAFAYYILFPPAVRYLLFLGEDFRLMLRASDYFDFITLIMLAMGVIFQMPAVTYVLARIGIVNAKMLLSNWRIALIIILFVAAIISPTGDIPNMLLFAFPMVALYLVSIFVAWFFGRDRVTAQSNQI